MKSILLGVVLIGSFLLFALPSNTTAMTPKEAYNPSGVISISGNTALKNFANKTGGGNASSPYIISGYIFNVNGADSDAISISDTTYNLIIESCEIENVGSVGWSGTAISLNDCSNITITNIEILNTVAQYAIVVEQNSKNVQNIVIENNIVNGIADFGLYYASNNYEPSANVLFTNNTISTAQPSSVHTQGFQDVQNYGGTNVTFSSNTISGAYIGINSESNTTLASNTITNCSDQSISDNGGGDVLSNNLCNNAFTSDNLACGIYEYSDSSTISNNNCTGGQFGIEVEGNSNTITGNDLTTNDPTNQSNIYVMGDSNLINNNVCTGGRIGIQIGGNSNTVSSNDLITNNQNAFYISGNSNTGTGNSVCPASKENIMENLGTSNNIAYTSTCSGTSTTGTTTNNSTGNGSGTGTIAAFPLIAPLFVVAMACGVMIFSRKVKVVQR